MTDIAEVGFKVDTSGLERGADAADKFGSSMQRGIVEPTGAIEAAAKRAGISVDQMRARIAAAGANVAAFERQMAGGQTATQRFAQATGQTTAATTQATTATSRHTQAVTASSQAYVGVTQVANRYAAAIKAAQQANQGFGPSLPTKPVNNFEQALMDTGYAASRVGTMFDRLANTLTRRVFFAFMAREARELVGYLWNLGSVLSTVGDLSARLGMSSKTFQGLEFVAGLKAINSADVQAGMLKFTQGLDEAKRSITDMTMLFAANGIEIKNLTSEQALGKVANMVQKAGSEMQKFTILQQAGLPATREWVKLMEGGAVGLALAKRAAEEFGRTVDDHMIRKAQQFEETWNSFTTKAGVALRTGVIATFTIMEMMWKKTVDVMTAIWNNTPMGKMGEFYARFFTAVGVAASSAPPTQRFRPAPIPNADPLANRRVGEGFLDLQKPTGDKTRNVEDELKLIAAQRQRISVLGELATVEQQVRDHELALDESGLRLVGVSKEMREKLIALARARADGTLEIRAQADASKIEAETIGLSIGAATELRIVRERELAAQRIGQEVSARTREGWEREAKAAGAAAQALEKKRINQDIGREGAMLLLSPENVQIAERLKGIYPDITTALNSSEAAAMRFNNIMKFTVDTVREIGTAIMSSVVHSLMEGKDVVQELSDALKNLSMRLADKAIEALLSGDLMKAGIAGVSAAATFLASKFLDKKDEKELETAKLKFAEMSDQVRNFNTAASGFDLSPYVAAIQQIKSTALDLIKAAMAAKDTAAAVQIMVSGVRQVNNTVDNFIKPKGDDVPSRIAAVNDEANQLIAELDDLNKQYNLHLNRTADILAGAAAHIADIQKKAQEEIEKRRAGFSDRLLTASSDPNTLEGALAVLDRQQQREREEEVKAGGEALIDLEATQARERYNVVRDYNDRIAEDARKTAQEQLEAQTRAARQIVDYINGVNTGSSSALSPTARLAQAQAVYDTKLALAAANNADALSSITADAEVLRTALRDMFGSTTAYQSAWGTIQSQLIGLPAVQDSEDPVVVALRELISPLLTDIEVNTGATSDQLGTGLTIAALLSNIQGYIGSGDQTGLRAQVDALKTFIGGDDNSGLRNISRLMYEAVGTGDATGMRKLISDLNTYIGPNDQTGLRNLTNQMYAAIGTGDGTGLRLLVDQLGDYVGQNSSAGMQKIINDMYVAIGTGDSAGLRNLVFQAKSATDALSGPLADTKFNTEETSDRIGTPSGTAMSGILKVLTDALVLNNTQVGSNTITNLNAAGANSDSVIVALRKIVYNTGIIALNTNTAQSSRGYGIFATGGWITGGTPGRDSVPIMAMPDEYVLQASATRALVSRFGRGALDMLNAGQLPIEVPMAPGMAALGYGGDRDDRMADRIDDLEEAMRRVERAVIAGAEHVRDGIDGVKKTQEDILREATTPRGF